MYSKREEVLPGRNLPHLARRWMGSLAATSVHRLSDINVRSRGTVVSPIQLLSRYRPKLAHTIHLDGGLT